MTYRLGAVSGAMLDAIMKENETETISTQWSEIEQALQRAESREVADYLRSLRVGGTI